MEARRSLVVNINGMVVNLSHISACEIVSYVNFSYVQLTLLSGEQIRVRYEAAPEVYSAVVRWYNSVPRVEDVW